MIEEKWSTSQCDMKTSKRTAIKAKAPKTVLKKAIDADFKQLVLAIGKAAVHVGVGNWEEVAADAIDGMASLGLTSEPEELLFLLVKRSLIAAAFELLGDGVATELSVSKADARAALDKIHVDEQEFEVSGEIFARPGELPIVRAVASSIAEWLTHCGIASDAAESIAVRLPVYFTYAINVEWRRNQKSYRPILEVFESPFAKAGERVWEWSQYFALLDKRTNESVFDESFGLRQIYVPLNAYYETNRQDSMREKTHREGRFRTVVSLSKELQEWISKGDANDAVRVLSGGPGSGKSSFSKIFVADLSKEGNVRPLFVPLHLIDPTKDLVEEVGRFFRDEGVLGFNPLIIEGEDDVLLVFDGLDELASQGKAAAETARAFVREVDRVVHRINMVRLRLRVLISGREVVVQENEAEFRRPNQILNVLPYTLKIRGDQDVQEKGYDDPLGLLDVDLRNLWWKRYGEVSGQAYVGLPGPLDRADLDEVTAQPLLNYLVALSYVRETIDFTGNVNLNSVYGDLVAAVHERAYEKGRSYGPIRHMRADDFARVLEEVGLAAWHGDGRTTTVREIEEHCRSSGLGALLGLFKEGAQAGVTRLLAAFFFRQHGQRTSGDPTFVFTHKSFGEYLAARRVLRAIERICVELERRATSPDAGWDEKDALKHWVEITGPAGLTPYLHTFLLNEIALRPRDQIETWLPRLAEIFSYVLNRGMPIERTQIASFKEALFQSRNSEEALLVAVNACAKTVRRVAKISVSDRTAFGAWFRRIQGQRTSAESALAARCLSYLDLSGCVLDIGDFYGADFSHSMLRNISAHYTCFMHSNFTGVVMTGAILEEVSFEGANLEDAVLANIHVDEELLVPFDRPRSRGIFTGQQLASMKAISSSRRRK